MKIKGVRVLKLFKIEGMVLYPFILFTSKHPERDIENHERIHWDQIKRDGVLKFYYRYLREYFMGRRRGLSHDQAYRNISYEREAYLNQINHQYKITSR